VYWLEVGGVKDRLAQLNPVWAAPEVLEPGGVRQAENVYLMGMMLWEFVTRGAPISGAQPLFIRTMVLNGERTEHTSPH
jgi:Protein tyrosine and serine/threonine kinase